MAVITITPADVLPPADSTTAVFNSFPVIAGETLVAGDWIYKKTSDGRYYKADNSTEEKSKVTGMAACGAYAGQRFVMLVKDSNLPIGIDGLQGPVFAISATAGKMCQIQDVTSTSGIYLIPLAQSVTGNNISFNCSTPVPGIINE